MIFIHARMFKYQRILRKFSRCFWTSCVQRCMGSTEIISEKAFDLGCTVDSKTKNCWMILIWRAFIGVFNKFSHGFQTWLSKICDLRGSFRAGISLFMQFFSFYFSILIVMSNDWEWLGRKWIRFYSGQTFLHEIYSWECELWKNWIGNWILQENNDEKEQIEYNLDSMHFEDFCSSQEEKCLFTFFIFTRICMLHSTWNSCVNICVSTYITKVFTVLLDLVCAALYGKHWNNFWKSFRPWMCSGFKNKKPLNDFDLKNFHRSFQQIFTWVSDFTQ